MTGVQTCALPISFTLNILEKNQNPNEQITYEIFSGQGRKITEGKFSGKSSKISDLVDSPPGLYVIKLKVGSQYIGSRKFVKIK